ncbi:MAG: hypothetical protein J7545_13590 [Roseofilum sp. SBFL]|uniref:type II toxin-antitoxin system Phd/YefM family antitoxin n=1 Tax=unclassified Roseofilum TaxID=2620099 RepID=UPI001B29A2F1|nr:MULTISPECIES: hypothetical protein [unclassified Roseofilum]MBP0039596.1 hypothetical protein [Roseofilum sp. SID1]MBP0042982.1 hypothetical protein [Roseofilum sp. SBFL]
METLSKNKYADLIDKLIERSIKNAEPILLQGAAGNPIVISETDWNAIQETLYLQSISGRSESLKKGGKTPVEDCIDESTIRDILSDRTHLVCSGIFYYQSSHYSRPLFSRH